MPNDDQKLKEQNQAAADINRDCCCITLDTQALARQLDKDELLKGLYQEIQLTRPHLFSATSAFISSSQAAELQELVTLITQLVKLPGYREKVLAYAPPVAQADFGPRSAFLGFDFHLSDEGPRLIEINTNAGGALLNAELARAQEACCEGVKINVDFEQMFYEMFIQEWKLQRGEAPLRTMAIIDEKPSEQYLYPEFKLFQRLLANRGITTTIADVGQLQLQNGKMYIDDQCIDLIYNRLTDFYFEHPQAAVLRAGYLNQAVVVTPNPHHHAVYANKENLILLSNADELKQLSLPLQDQARLLQNIPRTVKVSQANGTQLWQNRHELFFKPSSGFGSKATYRGDKLTRRVWEQILQGKYVAQKIIPPSKRVVKVDGKATDLKLDLRVYVYDGSVQLLAARLYAGQTTNFRTPGGGFAPVSVLPDK
jgi:hypothetical protein